MFTIQSTFVAPAGFVVVASSNPLLQPRSHAKNLALTSYNSALAQAQPAYCNSCSPARMCGCNNCPVHIESFGPAQNDTMP